MNNDFKLIVNCTIGKTTKVNEFVNLYGCKIGNFCMIGPFVEIQKDVVIGDKVKIGSHSFICEGVAIHDGVFIGHGVMFTNDKYPKSISEKGKLKKKGDWKLLKTVIEENASIGSNVTLIGGIVVGKNAIVGAGSVVTKNVPENAIVAGNPARII